jgi:chromosome segregation ATPase
MMTEQNEGMQHASDIDQTQILSLKKDLQQLTSENYKLVAELKDNFKTVSMFKQSNISLKQKNNEMNNLKDGFHDEMKKIVTQNSDYLKQITDLEEVIDNLNKQQGEYQAEIEGIVTQNSDYLKQITDLEEVIDNLNIELSIVKKAHASFVPQANKEKESLTSEINLLCKKISNLTEQVRMLKQRKKDLMNSNSYQIGQIFAKAIAEPGFNTVLMPFKLVRFIVLLLFKRD